MVYIYFMIKYAPLLIFTLLFAQGIGKPIGIRDLHLKADGLYYSSYTDTPFTGIVSGPYTEVIHHYNKYTFVKKNIQGKIIDGKREGVWTTYSEKGNLLWKLHYKNGNYFFSEDYHENGNLKSRGYYKNSEPAGLWEVFNEDGNLIESTAFKG